jgi:hypothetical protein
MTNSQTLQINSFQDRFGKSVAARLSEATDQLPHDISERLRFARMQALSKHQVVQVQVAPAMSISGGVASLQLGGGDNSFWVRIASILPLLALIAGLMTIAVISEDDRTNDIAKIDAELLTDELPPDAYTDPGFAQFLRMNRRD